MKLSPIPISTNTWSVISVVECHKKVNSIPMSTATTTIASWLIQGSIEIKVNTSTQGIVTERGQRAGPLQSLCEIPGLPWHHSYSTLVPCWIRKLDQLGLRQLFHPLLAIQVFWKKWTFWHNNITFTLCIRKPKILSSKAAKLPSKAVSDAECLEVAFYVMSNPSNKTCQEVSHHHSGNRCLAII